MAEWSEREREIRERLEGGLHAREHFGWTIESLRAAMLEIERLRGELEAKAKRRERKT